jgi:hypothetical protein
MKTKDKVETFTKISNDEKAMYLMFAGWNRELNYPPNSKRTDEMYWRTPGNDIVDTDYAFLLLKIFYE